MIQLEDTYVPTGLRNFMYRGTTRADMLLQEKRRKVSISLFIDPCEIGHLIAFRILVPGTGASGIKLEGIYTLEMAQVLSKRIFVEKHLSLDYKFARLCQSRVNSFRTHNPERLDL